MDSNIWAVAGIITGFMSAAAWFGAVFIPPSHTKSYFGKTPDNIIRRQKIGAACNAVGAFFAASSMACQAMALVNG